MPIVQQASGTFTGTSFTPTLPAASSASNCVVIIVAANTSITVPSGWTLRTSQVNLMGHYLFDRAGASLNSVAISNGLGQGTWWIAEIAGGAYDTSASVNAGSGLSTTYATPSLTPSAGTRIVIASLGSTVTGGATRTLSGWTNGFVEQADLAFAGNDGPMQGVAVLDSLAASGATAYTTTGTYSTSSNGRTAIIASYATTSGGGSTSGTAVGAAARGGSRAVDGLPGAGGTARGSVASSGGGAAASPGLPAPVGSPSGTAWALDFRDEFEGTTLDTTKWVAKNDSNPAAMNNVALSPANVAVAGGNLVLTLSSSTVGATISSAPGEGATVGYLLPTNAYAEARVYFPGDGTSFYNWPAWWTSGSSWPTNGENDIAEVIGQQLTANYHGGPTAGSDTLGRNGPQVPGSWQNAFHTYGIYRRAAFVDVYWDGKLVQSYPTRPTEGGECLLVNIGASGTAVTGTAGQVKVDYVRTWLRVGAEPVLTSITETLPGGTQAGTPPGWSQQTLSGSVAVDSSGRLALTTAASYYGLTSGVMWAAMEPAVDTDVTFEVTVPTLGEQYPGISIRSTYPRDDRPYPRDGYTLELAPSSGSLTLMASVYGVNDEVRIGSAAFTFAANVVTKGRFQAIGSTIRARLWTGATEPATWPISVTDTRVTTPGRVMLNGSTGADSVARTAAWDNFSATSPGGAAGTAPGSVAGGSSRGTSGSISAGAARPGTIAAGGGQASGGLPVAGAVAQGAAASAGGSYAPGSVSASSSIPATAQGSPSSSSGASALGSTSAGAARLGSPAGGAGSAAPGTATAGALQTGAPAGSTGRGASGSTSAGVGAIGSAAGGSGAAAGSSPSGVALVLGSAAPSGSSASTGLAAAVQTAAAPGARASSSGQTLGGSTSAGALALGAQASSGAGAVQGAPSSGQAASATGSQASSGGSARPGAPQAGAVALGGQAAASEAGQPGEVRNGSTVQGSPAGSSGSTVAGNPTAGSSIPATAVGSAASTGSSATAGQPSAGALFAGGSATSSGRTLAGAWVGVAVALGQAARSSGRAAAGRGVIVPLGTPVRRPRLHVTPNGATLAIEQTTGALRTGVRAGTLYLDHD